MRHDLERGGRRGVATDDLCQHFVLRPEGLLTPAGDREDMVDRDQRTRTMRNANDDAAARANAENGLGERILAFCIEIRIWFVEHDEERIAVERARQRDPLPLSGRQRRALFANRRTVAGRNVDDQLVNPGGLGRSDDGFGGAAGSKRAMFSAIVPSISSTSCGR